MFANSNYYICMSQKSEDKQKLKRLSYTTILTVRLSGKIKDKFFDDCIQRSLCESHNAKRIMKIYYSLMENRPDLKWKESEEIIKAISQSL